MDDVTVQGVEWDEKSGKHDLPGALKGSPSLREKA